jgi:hypothetical protein
MPLFGRNSAETAPPAHETTVEDSQRRSGLFGRHRSPESTTTATTTANGHHGFLHRKAEDPSIVAARERVLRAEAAERDADKALLNAKAAVREAREQVKRLGREAAEESVTYLLSVGVAAVLLLRVR